LSKQLFKENLYESFQLIICFYKLSSFVVIERSWVFSGRWRGE